MNNLAVLERFFSFTPPAIEPLAVTPIFILLMFPFCWLSLWSMAAAICAWVASTLVFGRKVSLSKFCVRCRDVPRVRRHSGIRAAPGIRGRRGPEALRPHRAVAEAVEGVLPAQDRGERGDLGYGRRVQVVGGAAVVIPPQLHEVVEGPRGGGGIIDDAEGIEIPLIGRGGYGDIARQKRDAFRQRVSPQRPPPAATGAADFESFALGLR